MPCYDQRRWREYADEYDDFSRIQARLDLATRVACTALRKLAELHALASLDAEAQAWWADHQRADAEAAQNRLAALAEPILAEMRQLYRDARQHNLAATKARLAVLQERLARVERASLQRASIPDGEDKEP